MSIPAAIAAGAALVCFVGGQLAASEVCTPVSKSAAVPDTRSIADKLLDGTEGFVIDDLKPLETRAPRTSTAAAPSPSSYAVIPVSPKGAAAAKQKCGVVSTVGLDASTAQCLISTGAYRAAGSAPAAGTPALNAAGQKCEPTKPVWFWGFIPLGLLAVVLLLSGSGRREGIEYVSGGENEPDDLPEAPAAPTFDTAAAGGQQAPPTGTATPPRSAPTAHFDNFDDEDF